MGGEVREPNERARDLRRVAELYLQGRSQAEIADEVKISQPTVSRHLTELQAEWFQSSVREYGVVKAEQLARIDRLEREYWDAWIRSMAETVNTGEKRSVGGGERAGPRRHEKSTKKIQRIGNPQVLSG